MESITRLILMETFALIYKYISEKLKYIASRDGNYYLHFI